MNFQEIKQLDDEYGAKTFSRYPVAIERGQGAELYDTEGKRYIDFGAGIAVNIFGANDEEWKQAVIAQLNKIQHVSNLYYNEAQARLAALVCQKGGAKRVFFANSGAEANECAFKAARKYSYMKYGAGRNKIVSLKNSFHGRTLFTLTATGQDVFHRYYDPFVGGVAIADCDLASVKKTAGDDCCAVIIECVQGESGVTELPAAFVASLADYCKENDILLIVDEVQTGNGRTGKFFAYEHYGISPDLVTTAKGIAGGLPLGACLFYDKTENVYAPGDHGSTFGGNPVACAGAESILSRITEDFLLEVQGKSAYMRAKLKGFDGVARVTGLGLMIGLEFKEKTAKQVAKTCLDKGLLVLTAHDRLRIVPPLNITKTQMDEGLSVLKEVLK